MQTKRTNSVSGRQFITAFGIVVSLSTLCSSVANADNTYYSWLSSQPEVIQAHSYRSQAEIDADHHGPPDGTVVYDPAEDAARFEMESDSGSAGGLISEFAPTSSGNLLAYWEVMYESGFVEEKDESNKINGTLRTHKAFRLGRKDSPGENRRLEFRTRFDLVGPPYVAKVDGRLYAWEAPGEDQPIPNQSNDFFVQTETWAQFWVYVDFDNLTFSLWVADEDIPPVLLFDEFQFTSMTGEMEGLDNFAFSFNSSQERSGPPLYIWARNLVVLHNVPDVHEYIAAGKVVRPMPPQNVVAEENQ